MSCHPSPASRGMPARHALESVADQRGMRIMYYSDHEPPHFHARYGGFKASIAITDGRLLVGQLPARVRGLVEEWRSTYRAELLEDWGRARQGLPLVRIAPLA